MSGEDGEFFGTTAADAQTNLELVLAAAATAAGIVGTTASATATVLTLHTYVTATTDRCGSGGSSATVLAEARRAGHAAIETSAKETCHVGAADGNPILPLPYAATPDRNGVTPIHHAAIAGR
jgi:hypothetical protein